MKTITLTHVELALIIGCLARSKQELEVLSDQFLMEFKRDLEALLVRLES